jgi:hypothetical protein
MYRGNAVIISSATSFPSLPEEMVDMILRMVLFDRVDGVEVWKELFESSVLRRPYGRLADWFTLGRVSRLFERLLLPLAPNWTIMVLHVVRTWGLCKVNAWQKNPALARAAVYLHVEKVRLLFRIDELTIAEGVTYYSPVFKRVSEAPLALQNLRQARYPRSGVKTIVLSMLGCYERMSTVWRKFREKYVCTAACCECNIPMKTTI